MSSSDLTFAVISTDSNFSKEKKGRIEGKKKIICCRREKKVKNYQFGLAKNSFNPAFVILNCSIYSIVDLGKYDSTMYTHKIIQKQLHIPIFLSAIIVIHLTQLLVFIYTCK